MDRDGTFEFPPGSIDAALSAYVDGELHRLFASNADTVRGHASPSTNALSLSGLRFVYVDPLLTAELFLDIQASYTQRPPTASVSLLSAPRLCSDPVAFRASSADLDGDVLRHSWRAAERAVFGEGELFEVVLPAGTHTIELLSVDAKGAPSSARLVYKRVCR